MKMADMRRTVLLLGILLFTAFAPLPDYFLAWRGEGILFHGLIEVSNQASTQPRNFTLYLNGSQNDSLAIIAHTELAGSHFSELQGGDRLIVYVGGEWREFLVYSFRRMQVVGDGYMDLGTGDQLTEEALFAEIFNHAGHLVLQTCITQDENPTWGRLFITALEINR